MFNKPYTFGHIVYNKYIIKLVYDKLSMPWQICPLLGWEPWLQMWQYCIVQCLKKVEIIHQRDSWRDSWRDNSLAKWTNCTGCTLTRCTNLQPLLFPSKLYSSLQYQYGHLIQDHLWQDEMKVWLNIFISFLFLKQYPTCKELRK